MSETWYDMALSPITSVITMVDIGLTENEHYVQFVPPATFGVILDRETNKMYLVRADGEKVRLRRAADKIYTLRGFIGLRQREERDIVLGNEIEDDMIRSILITFEDLTELRDAVFDYCPCEDNAHIIITIWGKHLLGDTTDAEGTSLASVANL